jgi:hypothetical protein
MIWLTAQKLRWILAGLDVERKATPSGDEGVRLSCCSIEMVLELRDAVELVEELTRVLKEDRYADFDVDPGEAVVGWLRYRVADEYDD